MDRPHRRRGETPAATNQQLELFPLLESAPAVQESKDSGGVREGTASPVTSEIAAASASFVAADLFSSANREDPLAAQLASCQGLDEISSIARQCRRCRLRAGCKQVVFGEGNPHAELMVVGEAPGATEDELGRPFVGRAGQLLDRMLAATGFTREEVYITNTVKCRPPDNRVPAPDERETCFPYLQAQIAMIRPRMILCLGSPSLQTLVGPEARITRDHGKWFNWRGVPVIATFHPAALLRDPSKKPLAWQDLLELRRKFIEIGGHFHGLRGAEGQKTRSGVTPDTGDAAAEQSQSQTAHVGRRSG
ncbi:MAG: uracil-DNA glycosylase [Limnochordales bacterium]|nr:uracil-DNA glycosylase [Limnochordales bacterium]